MCIKHMIDGMSPEPGARQFREDVVPTALPAAGHLVPYVLVKNLWCTVFLYQRPFCPRYRTT